MSTTVSTNLSDLPAVTGGNTTKPPSSALGKDEFMTLLTTQLKYQDPSQPVDNSQMIAQLAQFSQLEELQGLSSKIDAMTVATASSSQIATAQLVGKQALFEADKIGLVAGTPSTFQLSLPEATDDTTAVISDANGKVVRTLHLGPRAGGDAQVSWDGLDDAGRSLPSGEYVLSVAGSKKDGSTVKASARVQATITGVRYEDGVAQLLVAGRQIPLSSVVQITDPTAGN